MRAYAFFFLFCGSQFGDIRTREKSDFVYFIRLLAPLRGVLVVAGLMLFFVSSTTGRLPIMWNREKKKPRGGTRILAYAPETHFGVPFVLFLCASSPVAAFGAVRSECESIIFLSVSRSKTHEKRVAFPSLPLVSTRQAAQNCGGLYGGGGVRCVCLSSCRHRHGWS